MKDENPEKEDVAEKFRHASFFYKQMYILWLYCDLMRIEPRNV
jgi:hypothetical protein